MPAKKKQKKISVHLTAPPPADVEDYAADETESEDAEEQEQQKAHKQLPQRKNDNDVLLSCGVNEDEEAETKDEEDLRAKVIAAPKREADSNATSTKRKLVETIGANGQAKTTTVIATEVPITSVYLEETFQLLVLVATSTHTQADLQESTRCLRANNFEVFNFAQACDFQTAAKYLIDTFPDAFADEHIVGLTNELYTLFSGYLVVIMFFNWMQASYTNVKHTKFAIIGATTTQMRDSFRYLEKKGAIVMDNLQAQRLQLPDFPPRDFKWQQIPNFSMWNSHDEDLMMHKCKGQNTHFAFLQEIESKTAFDNPVTKDFVVILLRATKKYVNAFNKKGWGVYSDQQVYNTMANRMLFTTRETNEICFTTTPDEASRTHPAIVSHFFTGWLRKVCHKYYKSRLVSRRFEKWWNFWKARKANKHLQAVVCGLDPVYHAADIQKLQQFGAIVVAEKFALADCRTNVDYVFEDLEDLDSKLKQVWTTNQEFCFPSN
jgi:hypothetical protein